MRIRLTGIFAFFLLFSFSQRTFFTPADSLHKNRLLLTTSAVTGIWAGSIFALNSVWYSDYERTKLHSFDDSKNWLQMDKAGHFYATYHFSELVSKTFRWSGLSEKKSALLGSGVGWGYQFSIEILDGFSSGWGFSWADLASNSMGSLLYAAQQLAFSKQVVKVKFSYLPSKFAVYRPEILGSTFSERLLKDYNAQTYWLSFSPFQLKKDSKLKWISLALGYSVDAKLVGDQEYYSTPDGSMTFYAKREWILSLDIDVKELPVKRKWLKVLLSPFNSIKLPLPSLLWRGNTCYGKWIY